MILLCLLIYILKASFCWLLLCSENCCLYNIIFLLAIIKARDFFIINLFTVRLCECCVNVDTLVKNKSYMVMCECVLHFSVSEPFYVDVSFLYFVLVWCLNSHIMFMKICACIYQQLFRTTLYVFGIWLRNNCSKKWFEKLNFKG